MKAVEFDQKFDDGEDDIVDYLDLSKAHRPGIKQQQFKRVSLKVSIVNRRMRYVRVISYHSTKVFLSKIRYINLQNPLR